MNHWPEILRRNRTAIILFTVMVLLPSLFLTVVSLRAIRTEDARQRIQRAQRQTQIAELLDADLIEWLFAVGPDGASSQALLMFRIENDRPVFPGLNITIEGHGGPLPSSLRDEETTLDDEPVTDVVRVEQIYYPRIQAFLRDLKAGKNSGAQYFRRLKAMIVLMPDANGYVLGTLRLRQHLSSIDCWILRSSKKAKRHFLSLRSIFFLPRMRRCRHFGSPGRSNTCSFRGQQTLTDLMSWAIAPPSCNACRT